MGVLNLSGFRTPFDSMPIYSYKCASHGIFDARKYMDERNEKTLCPKCRRVSTRHYTLTPVIYKTDGFFSIDSGQRFESQLSEDGKKKYRQKRAEGKV